MSAVEDRLAELGLALPGVVPPVAAYRPAVRSGAYVYTSGQVPIVEGKLPVTGKVGAEVTPEEAAGLARTCALNALAAVINGASELLGQVLGEAGEHARSAVGVAVLPLDAPVEVEIQVELKD